MRSYTDCRCNTVNYCGSFPRYSECSIATRATASPMHSLQSRLGPMRQHLQYFPCVYTVTIFPRTVWYWSKPHSYVLPPLSCGQTSGQCTHMLLAMCLLFNRNSQSSCTHSLYLPPSGSHSLDLVTRSISGCVFRVKYFYKNKYE